MARETAETVRFKCGHEQTIIVALDTKAERERQAALLAEGECTNCARRRNNRKPDSKIGRCCDCGGYPRVLWLHHSGGYKCDDCY